jgi:dTDP-4-amino-4,6-dideoxygalactose transaminase
LEREIEALLRERTGRECMFVPSGRIALYLALRCWLSPGQRLLMSPLTDDVVFFVVLAAGIRPVMAPVSINDGNIDPAAVPPDTWAGVNGVLTTNLYGLPDALSELRLHCDRLGIPMIEDAAHAIESEFREQPVGTFGIASAFSLSKHVVRRGGGGILSFSDRSTRPELQRLLDDLTRGRSRRREVIDVFRPVAERTLGQLALVPAAHHALGRIGRLQRPEYRMPLRTAALRQAAAAAPDVEAFDRWLRVDLLDYRIKRRPFQLKRLLAAMRGLEADRARRLQGVRRLMELDVAAPGVRAGSSGGLFRVPLLLKDREAVRRELEDRGIWTGYIYDPPLDDYASTVFADASPSPDNARMWATHVLPVDPLDAERVLKALREVRGGLASPQRPPPPSRAT